MAKNIIKVFIAFALLGLTGKASQSETIILEKLSKLQSQKKFQRTLMYAGAETPEDGKKLSLLVNKAIEDIMNMEQPLDKNNVRKRLSRLLEEVDFFATADREEVHRYTIRIWKASGFNEESKLFGVPDKKVMGWF